VGIAVFFPPAVLQWLSPAFLVIQDTQIRGMAHPHLYKRIEKWGCQKDYWLILRQRVPSLVPQRERQKEKINQ
jgi:hypothetical protein